MSIYHLFDLTFDFAHASGLAALAIQHNQNEPLGAPTDVDPGFGISVLIGKPAAPLLIGADHDETSETEDWCGSEGEDRFGGGA